MTKTFCVQKLTFWPFPYLLCVNRGHFSIKTNQRVTYTSSVINMSHGNERKPCLHFLQVAFVTLTVYLVNPNSIRSMSLQIGKYQSANMSSVINSSQGNERNHFLQKGPLTSVLVNPASIQVMFSPRPISMCNIKVLW